MTFSELNLNSNIHKAIIACGYLKPTPIQAQSIPNILEGKDLIASAQTGTGKTAAFVLPALHKLCLNKPNKKTSVLILTPTRELANQITKSIGIYGKFLRYSVVNLVGGMPYHHQIRDLGRGADIIVATPGRLLDHIENKRVNLSNVEMLVLDEADRMLDMGFIDDVREIAQLTPGTRQTLLFSATVDSKVTSIIKELLKNPVRINLSDKMIAAPDIKQELYRTLNSQQKNRLLKTMLTDKNIYKAIVFSATKMNADKLAGQLCNEGFSAAALHGDLKQRVRNRTIEQFRRGKIQFLIATDVAARGIDIGDITHVINYDLPRFCEDYVHRIGRTGRAGKSGIAISFVLPTDTKHLQRIERYLGKRLNVLKVDGTEEMLQDKETKPRNKDFYSRDNRHTKTDFKKRKPFDPTKRTRGEGEARHEYAGNPSREKSHYAKRTRSESERTEISDKKTPRIYKKRPANKKWSSRKKESLS